MSQPKIISLKNREGKVFSSIVPTKDGQWLEIKKDYEFQSTKQKFKTREEWLRVRNNQYYKHEVVENEREPYRTKFQKWQDSPISSVYKDADYLIQVMIKYEIQVMPPAEKVNLNYKRRVKEDVIQYLKACIASGEGNLEDTKTRLERNETELSAVLKSLAENPTEDKKEYEVLQDEQIVAYVHTHENLEPIGYNSLDSIMVFKGIGGQTFAEIGLPERPTLWIARSNRLIKVI